ncbi:3-keto-5-aminohexanoate cleavage protein [Mycobacterium sp.]|uniref:3-keto-5-aminohexanoate cleavage protein n=1 Tax=Mycobacterium sp. TaxID=1785 RepID=UPI000CBD03A0|nr:3-keto-5-aminohexanoate cleavage protein [Mycobacterium sp.]MBX9980454.1 3-keto-5-aminohexanoate cleavage protein [Mycobacterium gordonae]PJE11210.1 MAG: 3-keto-5-aminohexanoate cleavage protein [Mycobacterium sp.]
MGPVVIECAINGATPKSANPHVPVEPSEITADALACIEAGAAIIHNHIDRYGIGVAEAAERYLQAWRPVLAARPDALLYPTIHFGAGFSISYEHLIPLAAAGMRVGLADPGSVNLGGTDADGLPTGDLVYRNSFQTISRAFEICRDAGLGPSLAIYEPGFLRTTLAWWRAGRLPQGAMIKLYFSTELGYLGAPFGLPPTERALDAYLELLDGCDIPWAVSVVGGDLCASPVARLALERGGHLHLGLEFYRGERTPTNVELVTEAADLCRQVGRAIATPDEAAQILRLPL